MSERRPAVPKLLRDTFVGSVSFEAVLLAGFNYWEPGFLTEKDAYSGFEGTDLKTRLNATGVRRVFVGGLATDYCVKETALDALKHGFETFLLIDAVKGVNVHPDDSAKSVLEMAQAGAKQITLSDLS